MCSISRQGDAAAFEFVLVLSRSAAGQAKRLAADVNPRRSSIGPRNLDAEPLSCFTRSQQSPISLFGEGDVGGASFFARLLL